MIALALDIFPKIRSQLREDIEKCPSVEVSEENWNSHSFKSQLLFLAETELRILRFGLPEADWNSWQSLEEVAEEWHKEDLGSWLSEVAWSSPIHVEDSGRLNDETKQVLGCIQARETWPVAVNQGYSQPRGDVNPDSRDSTAPEQDDDMDPDSSERPALEQDDDDEPFALLEIDGSTEYKTHT